MLPDCYSGRVLWIDLTSESTREENLDSSIYKSFIGGKGLGAYLLYRELEAGIDALSPDNVLLFLTGPLQGLPAPNVGRWTLVTKSPLTGLFLDSHSGGALGREIKKAGYDALGIKGRSKRPTYLTIDDGSIAFEKADDLWGMGVHAATRTLQEKNAKGSSVYVIGPAGENQVRFAVGCTELAHQTGRGGAGAVMGSKNLKAVVAHGTKKIAGVDVDTIREINRAVIKSWNMKVDYGFKSYGTAFLVEFASSMGLYPTRNSQNGYFDEYRRIDPAIMEKKWGLGTYQSCPHCVMKCTRTYKTESPDGSGAEVESTVEYETLGLLGGNIGVSDPQAILKMNYLCDDLGLDTISTGGCIGFAMEAYERGVLSEADIGFPLRFGDVDAAIQLIKMIASREGVGKTLSYGVRAASVEIGKGSVNFAVHVKGLEVPAWDPRGKKGLGLSYATAEVGASHLRGWPATSDPPSESALDVIDSMVTARDGKVLTDSLIVCHFTYHLPLPHEQKIALLNAATGFDYNELSISTFAHRIATLTRMFNVREGISRKDDILPERFWEPQKHGPREGMIAFVDKADFEASLDKFYEVRGWDRTGRPTGDTINSLGLESIF
jgi:aldehyde:ferredoxin oxidoreductase